MKLLLKRKFIEENHNCKKYYAIVEKDDKLVKFEIAKRQYNRTEVGSRIEITRFADFEEVDE